MKKRLFFPLLLICFIFSLNFTSCEEEEDTVVGLWGVIRNKAYSMEKWVTVEGKTVLFKYTVGFYAPSKGPWQRGPSEDGQYHPYCVFRRILTEEAGWMEPGADVDSFDIEINANGNKITEITYDGRPSSQKISFNISISGSSISLSSVRIWWDSDEGNRRRGSYALYNDDPSFNFSEGWEEFWPKVKNTAWIKQGDTNASVGFYEGGQGPKATISYEYFYLSMPNGNNYHSSASGDGEGRFYAQASDNPNPQSLDGFRRLSFYVTVSGDTMNITYFKVNNIEEREGTLWSVINPIWKFYDKTNSSTKVDISGSTLVTTFKGTYTKTSSPTWP